MTRIHFILLVLLVCSSFNIGKAEKSEESIDSPENTKNNDDEDESASIQVVQRDVATSKVANTLIKYDDIPQGEENHTDVIQVPNSTKSEAKYDTFFEDVISDSGDSIPLENQNENNEETTVVFIERKEYSNSKDVSSTDIEDTTKAYNHDEKGQEDSTMADEEENNWRSAEHFNSGEKKYVNDATNEESVEAEKDYSVKDYMDKKSDLKPRRRMDVSQPERRQYFNGRSMNFGQYRPPEEHDSAMRRLSEMLVPRYRPVLTRTGIVYTPTLFPIQTRPSLLDRLSGRSWLPNKVQMNPEPEALKSRHNRIMGAPQYEDSKMMDDYNDYGPNTNTYSYTPTKKVTTQAPPQQIAAPNKFDVFQKLVEASNHPKSQKRTLSEFPGLYYPQRQYPESFGSFNFRRVRRNAWDEPPFQDI